MRSLAKHNLTLVEASQDQAKLMNFLRMEWLADRPAHPGGAARQWLSDLYRENKLARGELVLADRRVDLGSDAGPRHLHRDRRRHAAADDTGAARPPRQRRLYGVCRQGWPHRSNGGRRTGKAPDPGTDLGSALQNVGDLGCHQGFRAWFSRKIVVAFWRKLASAVPDLPGARTLLARLGHPADLYPEDADA
jgi:hypothetical protein